MAGGRDGNDSLGVALNGEVRRAEPQSDGGCGVAAEITSQKFL